MKKLMLVMLVMIFLFSSCTDQQAEELPESPQSSQQLEPAQEKSSSTPQASEESSASQEESSTLLEEPEPDVADLPAMEAQQNSMATQQSQDPETDISDKLSMQITENNDGQLTIVIKNDTEYEGLTGEMFWLEYHDGSNWINIPMKEDHSFPETGYLVEARSELQIISSLDTFDIQNDLGRYRIKKIIEINGAKYELFSEA